MKVIKFIEILWYLDLYDVRNQNLKYQGVGFSKTFLKTSLNFQWENAWCLERTFCLTCQVFHSLFIDIQAKISLLV